MVENPLFELVVGFGALTVINSVLLSIMLAKRTKDLRLANRALELLFKNIKYEFEKEKENDK